MKTRSVQDLRAHWRSVFITDVTERLTEPSKKIPQDCLGNWGYDFVPSIIKHEPTASVVPRGYTIGGHVSVGGVSF